MVTQIVAGRVYDYSHCVGRGAVSGNGFNSAIGVALGHDGTAYVLNRGWEFVPGIPWDRAGRGSRVGIYTFGEAPGDEEFVSEFGKYGQADGEFIWPAGIALDRRRDVYVTDEWLNRVSVFDREGNFLRRWGSHGRGPGEFDGPSGIAADSEDNLYIVDSRNHRVQKFAADGTFMSQWGTLGDTPGQFNSPWGIALDHDGYVYVADHRNHRVQKFSPEGNFVAAFGSYGSGRGQLNRPSDVAVDPDGDVYVCDWANSRVQLFAPDGKFLSSFIGDARELSKWAQLVIQTNPEVLKRRREIKDPTIEWRLAFPTGVTFDAAKQRLIIVDTQRNRLQMYNKLKGYTEPQRNL
jgi:DNA-binding beta-propeller fold protein YncE